MMKRKILFVLAMAMAAMEGLAQPLEAGFQSPPPEARAQTWWHWMNGHVSSEGITADLEAMARAGVQEAQLFNVDGGFPVGECPYMSAQWLDMVRFAAQEAERLGMTLGFHNCAGWSSTGGPCVTPDLAMQTVVWTELHTRGRESGKSGESGENGESGESGENGENGESGELVLARPLTRFNHYRDIAVLAFPTPKSAMRIPNIEAKALNGKIRNHMEPDTQEPERDAVISEQSIINLSAMMDAEGRLNWTAPSGNWTILRIGHTTTGTYNHPSAAGGHGLEIDKMNPRATDHFWQHAIQPILNHLGPLAGTTVNNCIIDSYEVGTANYTPGFDRQFEALRGYSLLPYLPTLAGYYVGGGEQTERFLWDLRRTVSDLMAEHYYGRFRTLCRRHGLHLSVEPYWGPYHSLDMGMQGDIPMCEFWSGGLFFNESARLASSSAHLNGQPFVGAEAFTSFLSWQEHPASVKGLGERAWANGVNRLVFHTFAHQPWEAAPGLPMGGNGLEFNRFNTWWEPSKAFVDYINRAQYLLQQGRTVADVLVFAGEGAPNDGMSMSQITALGYDYDIAGPAALRQLTARDGFAVSAGGARYRVLLLPQSQWATPELLAKVLQLARGGVMVIGSKPVKSPSLSGWPACDDEVNRLAELIWGGGLAKDISITNLLSSADFTPDFDCHGVPNVGYTHRQCGDGTDIYFVDNQRAEPMSGCFTFRSTMGAPELWNAATGAILPAARWQVSADGMQTHVWLSLKQDEAVFVVFRPKPSANAPLEVMEENTAPVAMPGQGEIEIVSAQYGTFMPDGMSDVTREVASRVQEGRLDVSTHFADCAPGYIKQLHVAYELDGEPAQAMIAENEHLSLRAKTADGLKIVRAVYGKFDKALQGLPPHYLSHDVTARLHSLAAEGKRAILVEPSLDAQASLIPAEGGAHELRVTYTLHGEQFSTRAYAGETLTLGQAAPPSRIVWRNGRRVWQSPSAGKMNYRTANKARTVHIRAVDTPQQIAGAWDVQFKPAVGEPFEARLDSLYSWPRSADARIRYFSGTATYRKTFQVPAQWLKSRHKIELDLGDVRVIAQVRVNGQPAATLWQPPFCMDIDTLLHEGDNTLEVALTNLWPNAMIGDEQHPAEPGWQGRRPEWLDNPSARHSARKLFMPNRPWHKDSPLLPSGLLGPVVVRTYGEVELK